MTLSEDEELELLELEEEEFQQSQQNKPQESGIVDKAVDFGLGAVESGIKAATNIPSSGKRFVKDMFGAVTSPIQTGKGLFKVGAGAISKALPGEATTPGDIEAEQSFNQVADFFKKRYGSLDSARKTFEEDPVGFMGDLATLFTGVGALAGGAGKMATLSKLGRTGNVLSKAGKTLRSAGEVTEPLNVAGKTIKGAGNLGAEVLGMSTGTGGESMRIAAAGPKIIDKSLFKAMRGKVPESAIVEDARGALQKMKESRAAEYQKQLPKAMKNPIKFDSEMGQLKADLNKRIADFKINVKDDGSLDFSRANVSKSGQASVSEAVEKIRDWGNRPGDFTVEGLDTLKRQLSDILPETGEARAFIGSLEGKVRNTLKRNVPEYAKLVSDYEEASNSLKELSSTFSLTGKASADTILRKLNQTLKQNFELRQELLNGLDEATGGELTSQIAGLQLKPGAPRGLARTTAQLQATGGAVGVGAGVINIPAYLGILAASSPRLVGETLAILGVPNKIILQTVGKLSQKVPAPARQAAFQAGRTDRVQKEPKQEALEEIFR